MLRFYFLVLCIIVLVVALLHPVLAHSYTKARRLPGGALELCEVEVYIPYPLMKFCVVLTTERR